MKDIERNRLFRKLDDINRNLEKIILLLEDDVLSLEANVTLDGKEIDKGIRNAFEKEKYKKTGTTSEHEKE